MAYEKIFRTSKGSEYFRDNETGLWIRQGKDVPPAFYIGSINPAKNDAFIPYQERYSPYALLSQIYRSDDSGFTERQNVPGFTPRFEVGNAPLGVSCKLEEILGVEEGRIKLKATTSIHVGNLIVEVYLPLPPFMEQNRK